MVFGCLFAVFFLLDGIIQNSTLSLPLSLYLLTPKKQHLSSKAAERLDLELSHGSTVADLYEMAGKRLGE